MTIACLPRTLAVMLPGGEGPVREAFVLDLHVAPEGAIYARREESIRIQAHDIGEPAGSSSRSRVDVDEAGGPEWLTAEQAAHHLGMTLRAFYSAVARRQIPASRLGRRLRLSREGLHRLLACPSHPRRGKT